MAQAGLLEENRNHVWSDLSRLVDVGCKNGVSFYSAFFRLEVDGDVNMAQAGLFDRSVLLVESRNHVWRDLSRLVDVACKKWPVVYSKHFSGQKLM